jgi:hypothetical protein
MPTDAVKKSSALIIAFAWAIVVLPTAWGLNFTVQSALKLFTAPPTPVTAPAKPVPAAPSVK